MLKTKRCTIQMIQDSDYDDVKQLYRNHQVREYLGGAIEREEDIRYKFYNTLSQASDDSYYWTIRLDECGEFIGLVSLDQYHDGLNIEVSYELLPHYWGKGLATEVLETVLRYAFEDIGLAKIVAETQSANKRSCALLERAGMKIDKYIYRFGAEQAVYVKERNTANETI